MKPVLVPKTDPHALMTVTVAPPSALTMKYLYPLIIRTHTAAIAYRRAALHN